MIVIITTACEIERTGFHRVLVHVTNGARDPQHRSIFGVGVVRSCPLVAIYRAVRVARCNEQKWRRQRMEDHARRWKGLPLFAGQEVGA